VLGVAGCSGDSSPAPSTSSSSTTATITAPTPSASPSPSLTPEQQAAEEAKSAFIVYQRTIDEVNQRGGTKARQDLSTVAMNGQLEFLVDDANRLQANHWHQVGSSKIKRVSVQGVSLTKGKLPQVSLKACLDLSGTDAVDASGKSVRKPGTLPAFEQIVILTRVGGNQWLVSQEEDTPVKSC